MTSEDQYVEFVNARASALLRTAILLTAGNRALAEDLVQTVLVRAYAKRRQVRTPTETEAEARRSLVRAATRGRRDGVRQVDAGDAGRDVNRLSILDALRALPTRQRATVVLRYYDDYSEPQVAEALGCTAATARRHSVRAVETLRKHWAEEELRTSLAAAADPVRVEAELVTRVIEESRSARRQRRRSWWLTGCAAALAALVGVGLVFFDGSDDSLPKPDPPRLIEVDPIVWARQLPQGPPIRLAYLANRAVHLPDRRAPLPRDARRPIGKTPEGWLVTVNRDVRPHKGGLPAVRRYGLVTAKGTIELLPRDPYHGTPTMEALSPDGKLFAMGGALVDLAQRRVIGRAPANALYSTGWTPIGLLYIGGPDATGWLWRPGGRPIELSDRVWEAAANAPIGLALSGEDCMNVVHLAADGRVDVAYEGCSSGASSPISLSPDGSHALTADLSVLDVDEGTVTSLERPSSGIAGQLGWEDNDHFVLPFESRETTTRDRVVFVRCSITMHECERAGPEFTKPAGEQVLVA